jgi:dTDP-4-dehydrorhamnose reductase
VVDSTSQPGQKLRDAHAANTDTLLTGASGQLGSYMLREFARADASAVAWSGSHQGERFGYPIRPIDLTNLDDVANAFASIAPRTVIHSAALSRLDQCFSDPNTARRINTQATQQLVELAAARNVRFVYVSTDLVFDGEGEWYTETDAASPTSIYGATKLEAERYVLDYANGVVVRVSLLFGPSLAGQESFFDKQSVALHEHKPCTLFKDEWRTPLSLLSAARGLMAVAATDYQGLLHLGGPERMSRLEMGQRLARSLGLDDSLLQAASRTDIEFPEPRPRDTSLDSRLWRSLCPKTPWPYWDDAIAEFTR